jgi:steroid 5-alpha reductase family enzyme
VDGWTLVGTNLLLLLGVLSAAAVPSFRTKDPSYVDGLWGLGFVVVAASSWLQTDGDAGRRGLLVGLTVVWGVRLSTYLLRRWRRNGPDPRYQRLLGDQPANATLWLKVFVVQAFILTIVALPVQLGQLGAGGLSVLNAVGAVLAVVGIAVESVADSQLRRFKASANAGQVMDRGLWRLSRHPNYFGEAVTWWGIGLVAVHDAESLPALLGPLLITAFLLRWSGVGPLERQLKKTKPQYDDYIRRTSAFVPRRPKVTA